MSTPTAPAPTKNRFVETTLELISEEGGSLNVNLRQISRRMGCAHTNAYNYFPSYQGLLWEAFRRALEIYARALIHGLNTGLQPREYLRQVVENLTTFPQEQTGLYRFVGSDPINVEEIPEDILDTVVHMKAWLAGVFGAVAGVGMRPEEAAAAADIVLAYIDGETLNLINGRVIPSEDHRGRIVGNAMKLFDLLSNGGAGEERRSSPPLPDPQLIFGQR